jgi:hypothetical protein
MFDRPRVAEIAAEFGYDAAAAWVREHRDLYAQAIFHGFTDDDQRGEPVARRADT